MSRETVFPGSDAHNRASDTPSNHPTPATMMHPEARREDALPVHRDQPTVKACEKVRYRDRIAAELVLATIARKDGPNRRETRAYRCPRCKGWHLTSQVRGRRR